MSSRVNFAALLLVLMTLSACGFGPMYGAKKQIAPALSNVAIGLIPDYEGQYLRNALIDRFYRGGYPSAPSYTLDIDRIDERLSDLDITKSSDATRAQLRLKTTMKLRDVTGAVVLERDLMSITSYNILQSQFTTRVSENNARQNALDDLARQVENNLALFLARK